MLKEKILVFDRISEGLGVGTELIEFGLGH